MLRLFIWHKFKKILKNWSVMFFHSYLSNVYWISNLLRWRFFKAKMFILNEVSPVCTSNLTRKILHFWSSIIKSRPRMILELRFLERNKKVVWTIKVASRLKSCWATFKNYRSSKSVDKRFFIYYLTVQFITVC